MSSGFSPLFAHVRHSLLPDTLKRLAFQWARDAGLRLIDCEVRVPKSPYRANVAAASRHSLNADAVVALFECKQCPADFLRDQADESSTCRTAVDIATRI